MLFKLYSEGSGFERVYDLRGDRDSITDTSALRVGIGQFQRYGCFKSKFEI